MRLATPRPTDRATPSGIRPNAPYGTGGGSAARTPGERSRASAWSRRMNCSSERGSSRRAVGSAMPATHASVPAGPGDPKGLTMPGAAYQAADVVSKVIALALLPVYTAYLTRADYGTAENLLALVILVSIVVRLGVGEGFVRFWFVDEDLEWRLRLARITTA